MASEQVMQDEDTRTGVIMVTFLIISSIALGSALHFFWQRHQAAENKTQEAALLYLPLGEHTIPLGKRKLQVKFTLEYVNQGTEEALKKALPALKGQIAKRISRLQASDLRKLQTTQGKEDLASDILALVRSTLSAKDAKNVRNILYDKFLIGG